MFWKVYVQNLFVSWILFLLWEIWKVQKLVILNLENNFVLKVCVPFLCFFVIMFVLNLGYLMFYQLLWRRLPKNDEDSRNKIFKILDMSFISIKKTWNWHLVNFVFSNKGISCSPQHTDSHLCTRPGFSRLGARSELSFPKYSKSCASQFRNHNILL